MSLYLIADKEQNPPPLPDALDYKCPHCKKMDEVVWWRYNEKKGQYWVHCKCDKGAWKPLQGSKNRSAANKKLVKKYGRGFCELCLVKEINLNRVNHDLEGHHLIPHEWTADSRRENVWIVCKPCHKLIEHLRDYKRFMGAETKEEWTPTNPPASSTSSSPD